MYVLILRSSARGIVSEHCLAASRKSLLMPYTSPESDPTIVGWRLWQSGPRGGFIAESGAAAWDIRWTPGMAAIVLG